jgi:hypothetical protein
VKSCIRTDDWITISKLIFDNRGCDNCIEYLENKYNFVIIGYPESGLGYMVVWNILTKKAVKLCRMAIPQGIEFIDINDDRAIAKIVPDNLIFEDLVN